MFLFNLLIFIHFLFLRISQLLLVLQVYDFLYILIGYNLSKEMGNIWYRNAVCIFFII